MVLKNVLDVTFYGAAAVAIIALPFLFYNWIEYVRLRSRALSGSGALIPLPTVSISFFVIPILLAIPAATAIELTEGLRGYWTKKSGGGWKAARWPACRLLIRSFAVIREAETVPVRRNSSWLSASLCVMVTVPSYAVPR